MKCKACGSNLITIRKENTPTFNIRKRRCKSCGYKWETREMIIDIDAVFANVFSSNNLPISGKRESHAVPSMR
jgi:DNA-directed RNA polymerase subunit M/transcription elongation factor TFIIS